MASSAAALRKPVKLAASNRFSVVPDSYFDELPKRVSPTAYMLAGQILRRTKWSDAVRLTLPAWTRLEPKEMSQCLELDESSIRRGLAELENAGCIESRRHGRHWEYQPKVEAFTEVPVREWAPRKERTKGEGYRSILSDVEEASPSESEKPLRVPVALTCPKNLQCPVEELVEGEDGTFRNELKRGATPCNSKQHRSIMSDVVQLTPMDSTRAALRALVESRFVERLGTAPPDGLLDQVLAELRGASLEQYAHALDAHERKVKAWGILPHLAKDCARGRAVWEAAQQPRAMAAAMPAPEVMRPCERCGQMTYNLEDGLCLGCADGFRKPGARSPG